MANFTTMAEWGYYESMERHSCGDRYFGEPDAWLNAVEHEASEHEAQLGIVGALSYKNKLYLNLAEEVVEQAGVDIQRGPEYKKHRYDDQWSLKEVKVSNVISLPDNTEEQYRVIYARKRSVSKIEKAALIPRRMLIARKPNLELARLVTVRDMESVEDPLPKLIIKTFISAQEYFDIDVEDNINAFGPQLARIAVASGVSLKLSERQY